MEWTTSSRAWTRRRVLMVIAAAMASPAWAQGDKAVRFVLPNATGSGVDAITRSAQPALAKALSDPNPVTRGLASGLRRQDSFTCH